jgi:hypothetical protein
MRVTIAALRAENRELRAELAALRKGGCFPAADTERGGGGPGADGDSQAVLGGASPTDPAA